MLILRVVAATALVAAGIGLSACQTVPIHSNEADRACQDYGISPGMNGYEDCVAYVAQAIADAENDFENQYGPINPRFRCEVTEIKDGTVYGVCELIDYDI